MIANRQSLSEEFPKNRWEKGVAWPQFVRKRRFFRRFAAFFKSNPGHRITLSLRKRGSPEAITARKHHYPRPKISFWDRLLFYLGENVKVKKRNRKGRSDCKTGLKVVGEGYSSVATVPVSCTVWLN